MPILKELPRPELPPPTTWIDPDDIPRPITAFGIAMETTGRLELDFHRHKKAQVLLCLRGVLTCEAAGGLWLVPPHSAIWIPGDMLHAIKAEGTIEGYNAFLDPAIPSQLPPTCCTFTATPLLRELLIRSAGFPALYPEGGMESHLVTLLSDEINAAPISTLHLPMPVDERLRRIVGMMLATPSERGTIETWAKWAGLSERTLSRLVAQQTGMSFGRWRQQFTVVLAVQWLTKGASIQQVAADLGYESASSFVTMFRKSIGVSPGRYMAEMAEMTHSAQSSKRTVAAAGGESTRTLLQKGK